MSAKDSNSNAQSAAGDAMSVDETRVATSAIGKAFAILRALRHAPAALTLTNIAQEVGMAPSSAHSVLNQLLAQDAVKQDQDKRYRLGPEIFYLGAAYARSTPVYRAVWMEMVSTANELGVTAVLAVPWDNHHLILNSHRAGESGIAVPFGGRVPIDASSWGRVYYGWSGATLDHDPAPYTPASITSREEFLATVEEARRAGYATDREEFFAGAGGVAAPLTSDQGYEGLASFIAPLERCEQLGFDRLGRRLTGLTARASHALGDRERMHFASAPSKPSGQLSHWGRPRAVVRATRRRYGRPRSLDTPAIFGIRFRSSCTSIPTAARSS